MLPPNSNQLHVKLLTFHEPRRMAGESCAHVFAATRLRRRERVPRGKCQGNAVGILRPYSADSRGEKEKKKRKRQGIFASWFGGEMLKKNLH